MGTRHINPLLMLGLIAVPLLFVWFLLLPGYPRSTRIAAFTYALVLPVLVIVVMLITPAR